MKRTDFNHCRKLYSLMWTRRQALRQVLVTGIVALYAVLGTSQALGSSPVVKPYPLGGPPPNVLYLWLVRQATGEEIRATYAVNGRLDVDGYNKICHLMRDLRAPKGQQVVRMDINLLNLLFAVQQWLRLHGYYRPLIVISGYRTIQNNGQMEGTAKHSQHTLGRAVDFYVQGLPVQYLSNMVKFFRTGGVGLYPSNNFVHIDTGRVRYWQGN